MLSRPKCAKNASKSFVGKVRVGCRFLPAYAWQRLTRRSVPNPPVHLIIALADHFEPSILPDASGSYAEPREQARRLKRWCREYPKVVQDWPDSDGRPFCHTYFYPAEQYDKALLDCLAEHCSEGWGEVEIHLHHGHEAPDTAENTRRQLVEFRDALVQHGCLSQMDNQGTPRYAFVHGNFTLANWPRGLTCGVDTEMQILAETGCYADLTLPSAPHPAQTAKINSLYECALPLDRRAPHRQGRNLQCGRAPQIFPVIIQGPLMLNFARWMRGRPFPGIDNSALTASNPPSLQRLQLWRKAAITVRGRPDWLFIKLHCHGMNPRDEDATLGAPMREFLRELLEGARGGSEYKTHFVTAREMTNIILAACDGRDGNPGYYRDYRLKLLRPGPDRKVRLGLPTKEPAQER